MWLRDGTYYPGDTLVFGPQDGGAEGAPITYAAYPGETPVICGGRVIEAQWQPTRDGTWVCTLDEVREGNWDFRVLAVNGVRQRRAQPAGRVGPNVVYSTVGCVLNDPIVEGLPGVQSFADWRARGLDEHTITADPRFVDLANDDYTLQPESPAFKVGFVPLDLSKVGLRGRD